MPSLVALGLLVGFARREPEAAARALRRSAAARPRPAGRRPPAQRSRRRPLELDARPARRRRHGRPHLAAARHRRRAAPARPGRRDHLPRHAARARDPGRARGRLPARADPAGAAAAPARRRPAARARAGCAARVKAALEVVDRVAARRRRRLRRLRLGAGLPRGPRAASCPLVVHEGNALPGHRQQARRPVHHATSRPASPTPRCRTPRYVGLPIRRMISTLDRAALRAEARRDLRARRRPADAAGHRRLPGRPPAQPGRRRRPRARFADAGVQVLHVVGPEGRGRPATARRRPAVRRAAVRRPDGPRLRRRRRVLCRAGRQHRHRGRRRSACRRSSCRCRSATASRRSTPGPWSTPAAALLVADAALTPEWVAAHRARPAHRPRAAGGDVGAAAADLIPLDADEKLARMVLDAAEAAPMRVPVPDELLPADRARPRALRRHRRRRPVRHRPDHARPAASPVTGSDAKDVPHPRRRCARSAPPATSATTPPTSATPTPSSSRPRCARTTPRCVEARRRGLRLLPRSAGAASR